MTLVLARKILLLAEEFYFNGNYRKLISKYFDIKPPGTYILGGFGLGRFITPMPKRPAVVKRQAA